MRILASDGSFWILDYGYWMSLDFIDCVLTSIQNQVPSTQHLTGNSEILKNIGQKVCDRILCWDMAY
jgi:hypothetical protein